MRIQIASDLHLDSVRAKFPEDVLPEAAAADVLVLAGDIHRGTEAVAAFANWSVPVVYVNGNHEAYGGGYGELVDALSVRASGTQINYLERRSTVINKVRFVGCCLWTDYELYGDREQGMDYAREAMTDHEAILDNDGGSFSPEAALIEHRQSVTWLAQELKQPFEGKTVVVTHHGVSPASIHERFRGHAINPGFVSDLQHLHPLADLWIHGHVHDSFDYRSAGSRVVANPRGYPLNLASARNVAELRWENAAFDPACVVEI